MNEPRDAALSAKLQQGRPVHLTPDEADALVDALRAAIATTLDVTPDAVRDEAGMADELGVDSIDVFDALDQIAERFDVSVALEELPESVLRGGEGATFRDFADGLLSYFRDRPPEPPA